MAQQQQGGPANMDQYNANSSHHNGGFLPPPSHGDGNPVGKSFGAADEQERPRSGGFLRGDNTSTRGHTQQEWDTRHGHTQPLSQQLEQFNARSYNGPNVGQGGEQDMTLSQKGGSGKRRKKRRTAD